MRVHVTLVLGVDQGDVHIVDPLRDMLATRTRLVINVAHIPHIKAHRRASRALLTLMLLIGMKTDSNSRNGKWLIQQRTVLQPSELPR